VKLIEPGSEPRQSLRYRLRKNEQLTWQTRIQQRTVLRAEKKCPAPETSEASRRPPRQTLRLGYQLHVVTRVRAAMPDLLVLQTGFSNARLTLPPSLTDQRRLLTSLVENTRYRTRMTRQGHVRLFELGRLASSDLKAELKRLRSPLSALQPVLPGPAVGPGASWRQRRQITMVEPGGKITATYLTRYRLHRLVPAAAPAQAVLQVTGTVRLQGTLMGETFSGRGRSRSRVLLDLRRGLMLSARGKTRVCSAVLGQTSTNHTTFSQKLTDSRLVAPKSPGRNTTAPRKTAPARSGPTRSTPSGTATP
jgi:hypothetical protein